MRWMFVSLLLALASPTVAHGQTTPTAIGLEWVASGEVVESWRIERGGQGSFTYVDRRVRSFAVPEAEFDRVREALRAYEDAPFNCPGSGGTPMPVANISWVRTPENRQAQFDLGCMAPQADALMSGIQSATAIVGALRDHSPQ